MGNNEDNQTPKKETTKSNRKGNKKRRNGIRLPWYVLALPIVGVIVILFAFINEARLKREADEPVTQLPPAEYKRSLMSWIG